MVFVLGLCLLALFAYGLVDVVTTPRGAARRLPKWLWLIVVFLPLVGPLTWLLAGRPRRSRAAPSAPSRSAPDDDEDFLRDLRRRAEDQRRRARDPRDDDA